MFNPRVIALKVNINTDRGFILEKDTLGLPFKIDAVYTFGQPVVGSAEISLKV